MNRPQPPFPPLLAVLGLLLATWFSLTQTASAVFLPQDHRDLFAANSSPAEHQEANALTPENRVWENFENPNEITPADELNSPQLRWESRFGELELASGVLSYADGNPISRNDPFGLCACDGGGFMGYTSWGEYGREAADSLGGVSIGLLEGLSGGVIAVDNMTILQMNDLQRTGYHIGLTVSVIGAFIAPKATAAPARSGTAWPPNRGFQNPPNRVTIQPGSFIDRAGSTSGTFVAPQGTPFGQRSLPADFASKPVNSYEVMKPVGAEAGITAPWFNQQGGGIQFELGKPVQSLLDSGHLRSR